MELATSLHFVTALLLSAVVVGDALTCMNEDGNPTDWFVIYKLPKLEDRKGFVSQPLSVGLGYVYLDSKQQGSWKMPNKNISSSTSSLGLTVQNVFNENLSYLIYNDQPPDGKASSTFGHTKGIVAFDDITGIWLIHSIPRFPDDSKYEYPDTGRENGQSVLCITVPFAEINSIGKQLLYIRPKIYSKNSGSRVQKLDKDVQTLFDKRPAFIKRAPWSNEVNFTSKGKAKFRSLAKHYKFNKDLYDGLVAPTLNTPLFVESWRRGSGTIIPSTCNIKYTVRDVTDIDIAFTYNSKKDKMEFSSKEDHSKWAVSATSEQNYFCIGDLNRMESQKKRGGGTVCIQSAKLWKAFNSSINEYQDC